MKNILSYTPGTKIKGKEIKEWILYNINHQTSLSAEAKKMTKYLNIDDEKEYIISKGTYQESARSYQVIKTE